jgi:hypothetical protein
VVTIAANVLWCGTMPGGLFNSEDGGDSWTLNRSLRDDPLREQWSGGGAEYPGLHSICVNPRDSDDIVIGVSTGGAWTTLDGGKSWRIDGKGMRAEYMPPELQYEPKAQGAHLVVQCAAAPATLWVQHHNGIFRFDDSGEMLAFGSTTGSLWVSENGGNSWQTASLNLPPIHSVRFERAG